MGRAGGTHPGALLARGDGFQSHRGLGTLYGFLLVVDPGLTLDAASPAHERVLQLGIDFFQLPVSLLLCGFNPGSQLSQFLLFGNAAVQTVGLDRPGMDKPDSQPEAGRQHEPEDEHQEKFGGPGVPVTDVTVASPHFAYLPRGNPGLGESAAKETPALLQGRLPRKTCSFARRRNCSEMLPSSGADVKAQNNFFARGTPGRASPGGERLAFAEARLLRN